MADDHERMKNTKAILIGGLIIGGLAVMTKTLKTVSQSVIEIMAGAIRDWESGGNLSARNYRNNNPGNLRWFGDLDSIPWDGAMGVDSENHVVFDSYDNGWNALLHQLELAFSGRSQIYSPDMNLYQFFAKYAESGTENYARSVASALGVSPETALRDITVAG